MTFKCLKVIYIKLKPFQMKYFLSSYLDKYTFLTTWKFRLKCRILSFMPKFGGTDRASAQPLASSFFLYPTSVSECTPQLHPIYTAGVAMCHLEISREVPGRCYASWPGPFGQKILESWLLGTHSGRGMLWTECLCPPKFYIY